MGLVGLLGQVESLRLFSAPGGVFFKMIVRKRNCVGGVKPEKAISFPSIFLNETPTMVKTKNSFYQSFAFAFLDQILFLLQLRLFELRSTILDNYRMDTCNPLFLLDPMLKV